MAGARCLCAVQKKDETECVCVCDQYVKEYCLWASVENDMRLHA